MSDNGDDNVVNLKDFMKNRNKDLEKQPKSKKKKTGFVLKPIPYDFDELVVAANDLQKFCHILLKTSNIHNDILRELLSRIEKLEKENKKNEK